MSDVYPVQKIIIDTDFVRPPQDDALAVMLALKSPELKILGLTTVAGNASREQATTDLLWMLEKMGRTEIPVYEGADLPLVRRPTDFARKNWGKWYLDGSPPPPGGFASIRPAVGSAVDFLVRTVAESPGEITIIAIGPLTNIAMALAQDSAFEKNVRKLHVMGGAIAALPDGAGNMTPNAEFNFWVDPEAARVVLRSSMPIELSPLNVARKTAFKRRHLDRIISADTPVARILETTMSEAFQSKNRHLMYDQTAVAGVIAPSLFQKTRLIVDVDTHPGINYGVSVGGTSPWPGAEGARTIDVQYDIDWERFIELFIERLRTK